MADKSRRTLWSLVFLVAAYLVVVVAVRTWRADSSTPGVAVRGVSTSTTAGTRSAAPLTDGDLSTYDFLLRESENPRPHRSRTARTRPATSVTLSLDAATLPTTLETMPYYVDAPREPVIPLNVARAALDYVGADPDAELVWAYAINDPTLSPGDRANLIEDLNETGFNDPANVTADDLPVIVRRLQLIEYLAPEAMDEVNAAAFAEAYRDLNDLYSRAVSQLPTEEAGGPIPMTPGFPEGDGATLPTSLPIGQ